MLKSLAFTIQKDRQRGVKDRQKGKTDRQTDRKIDRQTEEK
jgi:hypothetical protein